jgi:hypothetical protein
VSTVNRLLPWGKLIVREEKVMEDIVAVEVELEDGDRCYFLTWGRIQDAVDPEPLERLIFERCRRFDLGGIPVRARLCGTLQEAVDAPYFYEYFFMMGQEKIPFGRRYKRWRREMNKKMLEGKELCHLGNPKRFRVQEK